MSGVFQSVWLCVCAFECAFVVCVCVCVFVLCVCTFVCVFVYVCVCTSSVRVFVRSYLPHVKRYGARQGPDSCCGRG